MNLFYKLFDVILEDVNLETSDAKTIKLKNAKTGEVINVDLSNFIYANTNGGNDVVTLYGVRANDSTSDPSKKAGNPMSMTGKLNFKYRPTGNPSPLGSKKQRYDNYDITTMKVTHVDGKKYPKEQIRNSKLNTVYKISMNREVYNILR